jgi:F-type H+-transporting ATPase subunit gamma
MANVLDLRRRIRSVKNTRQITKAMKMVSAAKLRRAQERALAARPYARMIVSVLESLRRRVDLYDEKTGNLCNALFLTRPEKRVLLIVISGDKGFAGAFNANILKTAYQFINGNPDKEIDIEAVGRKGRDQLRRRYPTAAYTDQTDEQGVTHKVRSPRQGPVEVTGDHPGLLVKLETSRVLDLAHNIISRYVHASLSSACFRSSILRTRRSPAPSSLPPKRRSARLRLLSPRASTLRPPTPPRPTKRPRSSAPRTSTTSTSSQPRSFSPACFRSTFFQCSFTP